MKKKELTKAEKPRKESLNEKIREQLKPKNKMKSILQKKVPVIVRKRRGRPCKYTIEYVKTCIEEYLASCWEPNRDVYGATITDEFDEIVWKQTKPYTLEGFDAWVGWDRVIRLEYEKRPEFTNTIKKLREIVYSHAVESLWKGQPSGVIFNLKNNWGWVDKIETEDKTPLENKPVTTIINKTYIQKPDDLPIEN